MGDRKAQWKQICAARSDFLRRSLDFHADAFRNDRALLSIVGFEDRIGTAAPKAFRIVQNERSRKKPAPKDQREPPGAPLPKGAPTS